MHEKTSFMGIDELSSRDLDIISHLSLGPSTYSALRRRFFPKRKKAGNDFDGTTVLASTSGYAITCLGRLRRQGFIQTESVGKDRTVIVALTKAGAKVAVAEFGGEIDNITCTLPSRSDRMHSIMVAATVRRIVLFESRTQDAYTVKEYKMARYLRRHRNGDKKKGYVPDFRINLKTVNSDENLLFYFIIDDYGTGRAEFFDKVSSFGGGDTIIVANGNDRLRLLFDNLIKDQEFLTVGAKGKIRRIKNSVFFVDWEDFARHGFKMAEFHVFPKWDRIAPPIKF